jgi:plastocyanin
MFASTLSVGFAVLPFVSAAVYQVTVGGGGSLAFDPPALAAREGDQVVFTFVAKNHTVTQSTFDKPCTPAYGGIDSGFVPVPANQTDGFPTFTVNVRDTKPIWMMCNQGAGTPNLHCGKGMIFAINCGADDAPNSLGNFKKAALAHGASLAAAAPASTPAGGYGGGYGGGSGQSEATKTYMAAYGTATVPPPATGVVVTQAVTLGSSSWVTTYTSYPGSPAPTPASLEGREITVVVGGPSGLIFDPPFVQAQPRDSIKFIFKQKNHTVTESTFDGPCIRKPDGFDSGFQAVAADATDFPSWTIKVNDTAPIWAYCRQRTPTSHCGEGMVFAINPNEQSPRNYAAFQKVAQALNGTLAAANAPQPTAESAGVISARVGAGLVTAIAMLFTLLM